MMMMMMMMMMTCLLCIASLWCPFVLIFHSFLRPFTVHFVTDHGLSSMHLVLILLFMILLS